MRKVYRIKNDTELKEVESKLKSTSLSRFEAPERERARDLGLTRSPKKLQN